MIFGTTSTWYWGHRFLHNQSHARAWPADGQTKPSNINSFEEGHFSRIHLTWILRHHSNFASLETFEPDIRATQTFKSFTPIDWNETRESFDPSWLSFTQFSHNYSRWLKCAFNGQEKIFKSRPRPSRPCFEIGRRGISPFYILQFCFAHLCIVAASRRAESINERL